MTQRKIKVAFFDTKPYDIKVFNELNKDYNFEFSFFEPKLREKNAKLAEGHQVVCPFVNDEINSGVIDKLKDLGVKLITMRCAGYNNIDLKHAFKKINVSRVPAYSPHAVAEHTLSLIMTLNRKIHKAYNRTRENNFTINGLLGFNLHQKTIGVIGTGKIGKIFLKILKGFEANVLAYDPYPDHEFSKQENFKYTDLETIYKNSHIITLFCPLTEQTNHLINEKTIQQMKNGVMIINTGRGKLINTHDLIEGLKSKKIGSAGLDVYEEEGEYFFQDFSEEVMSDDILARLLSFNNVLITSHQAFFTEEALNNIGTTTLDNIKDFFEKNILPNQICYQCDKTNCKKQIEGICSHKVK